MMKAEQLFKRTSRDNAAMATVYS